MPEKRLDEKSTKTMTIRKNSRRVSPGFIDGMKRFGVDEKVVDAAERRNQRLTGSKRAAG